VGEPNGIEATYFARLRAGESVANPSWLLRRSMSDAGVIDELLGRDGRWRSTRMLARTEAGELPGTLKKMVAPLARGMIRSVETEYGVVLRALERQQTGEFVLRLAEPGAAADMEPLDMEARADVAGFLTGAPLVVAGQAGAFRTDGMWVWPESIADAVLASGAPPEGEFHYHIRARLYFFPDSVAANVLERARRLLEKAADAGGGERVREVNVPGQPPPPTQEERLRQLGAWHAEWQRRHAPTTPFRPERYPDDPAYDQHYVDVEASREADWEYTVRAREIMGQDRETGQQIDL
jgi:hypothetical protein